ncbi:MAG: hypothetical protein WD295_01140, partial [Bacteroidota bacterium]
FYYGPGAFLGSAAVYRGARTREGMGLGVRFMFGVDYVFRRHPFDISFDVGPALFVAPVVAMGLEASLAFRFYPDL